MSSMMELSGKLFGLREDEEYGAASSDEASKASKHAEAMKSPKAKAVAHKAAAEMHRSAADLHEKLAKEHESAMSDNDGDEDDK